MIYLVIIVIVVTVYNAKVIELEKVVMNLNVNVQSILMEIYYLLIMLMIVKYKHYGVLLVIQPYFRQICLQIMKISLFIFKLI